MQIPGMMKHNIWSGWKPITKREITNYYNNRESQLAHQKKFNAVCAGETCVKAIRYNTLSKI